MKTQHNQKQINNGHKFKRGISLKKDIQMAKQTHEKMINTANY